VVVVAVPTSNANLADAPGNVLVKSRDTKLSRDCVVNVSALLTILCCSKVCSADVATLISCDHMGDVFVHCAECGGR
jgi:mRNA-degrading endonuclease toxin of MazEF toxin-antitoxin module